MITILPFLSNIEITFNSVKTVEKVFEEVFRHEHFQNITTSEKRRAILVDKVDGRKYSTYVQPREKLRGDFHLFISADLPLMTLVKIDHEFKIYDFLNYNVWKVEDILDVPLSEYVSDQKDDCPHQLFLDYYSFPEYSGNDNQKNHSEICKKYGLKHTFPFMSMFILEEQLRPWLRITLEYESPGKNGTIEEIASYLIDRLRIESDEIRRTLLIMLRALRDAFSNLGDNDVIEWKELMRWCKIL